MLKEPSSLSFLNQLQQIITRLAENSSKIKNWCISIISGLIALAVTKNNYEIACVSFIPILLFHILDSYYLSLENDFRDIYNDFVKDPKEEYLFVIKVPSKFCHRVPSIIKNMFCSFSTLPFYGISYFFVIVTIILGTK